MRHSRAGHHRPRLVIGGVARSVVLVGAASAIGQGALVIASPILARLYSPDAFGLLSVYGALLTILLAVSSLRFDLAIPIATEDDEAINLLLFAMLIAGGSSVILAVVLFAFGATIAEFLGVGAMAPLLWLLPIALLSASAAQSTASWAVYRRTFPALGRMRAIQGLTQAAAQIAFGALRVGAGGLIVGDVLGRIVGIEQFVRPLFRAVKGIHPNRSSMLRHARTHWAFARVMTVASLLNALSLQIPFLLIPSLFGLDASGQYFLAYRILVLPASLVGAGVGQVFFGEASHRRDDPQRLHDIALNVAVALLVFSIPTYTIVMVAGPDLIMVLFGPQWTEAGIYAQLMAPGLILWAVASPISTLLLVGRREHESLGFTLGELTLKTGCLLAGAAAGSMVAALAALTFAMIAINIGALWRILRVAGVSVLKLGRPGLKILATTLPAAGVVFLALGLPPIGVIAVAGCAWLVAVGLAARHSAEVRALMSGADD